MNKVNTNKKKRKSKRDLVIKADSRELSKHVKSNSVGFIVFSPPYWKLRDYKFKNQIGHGQSYKDYLTDMTKVVGECLKVLKPGRFMAVNIGTVVSNQGMKFIAGDFVIEFQKAGFTFRKDIIWHKPRGTTKWQRGATQFTQNPYPLMYNTNINHEFILIFQKGELQENPKKIAKKEFNKSFNRKMVYSVWDIIPVNSPTNDERHVAPYPEELPKRLIQLYTFDNDIVLDPFAGCGTTAKVAKMLGRKSISVEMSKDYCKLIRKKLASTKLKSDEEDIYSPTTDLDEAEKKLADAKKDYEKRLREYTKLFKKNNQLKL